MNFLLVTQHSKFNDDGWLVGALENTTAKYLSLRVQLQSIIIISIIQRRNKNIIMKRSRILTIEVARPEKRPSVAFFSFSCGPESFQLTLHYNTKQFCSESAGRNFNSLQQRRLIFFIWIATKARPFHNTREVIYREIILKHIIICRALLSTPLEKQRADYCRGRCTDAHFDSSLWLQAASLLIKLQKCNCAASSSTTFPINY